MKVIAQLNNLRIAPRKVALVVDQIRGLNVDKALITLNFNLKKPSDLIAKLLKSAIASAEKDFNLNRVDLVVSEIFVNEGRTLKRWMPRAYGRAYQILKRTSKVKLVLSNSLSLEKEANN